MNDSKKTDDVSESIEAQLEASIRTVLHYKIILPEGLEFEDNAAQVEEISDAIIKAIQILSKKYTGMRLNYNAAAQLPDGVDIPLI